MNIINEIPRATLASSGANSTATYYAREDLVVGDFVELSEDGNSVSKLSQGAYAGIVMATSSDQQIKAGAEETSRTVCVLSQGRVELPVDSSLRTAPALSFLKIEKGKLALARERELACAYLVRGEQNWSGTVVVDFFYPPLSLPTIETFLTQNKNNKDKTGGPL